MDLPEKIVAFSAIAQADDGYDTFAGLRLLDRMLLGDEMSNQLQALLWVHRFAVWIVATERR